MATASKTVVRPIQPRHEQPRNQNELTTVERKYESFAHILSISDNENLNRITKTDMLKNYIPWVPTNVTCVTMQQYNDWILNASNNFAQYNLSCHSRKYRNKKIKIIVELLTFILSIPHEVQKNYHFSKIQPEQIALFMERSFIPNHGREDPNVDINDTETTIIDKYIISNSSVRTAIGAISSYLSTNFGREEQWSIGNTRGNPCKSRQIRILYANVVKANDKRGVKIVHATPITASVLIELIDAFDVYNDGLKAKYQSKDPKARTLADILEILLIERDICYYIYMFISLQRGGDATKLASDNIRFVSSNQTDEMDSADFTIYPHQIKKQTFENKPKITFTINKNHNWHLKDGMYKDGMPDKYCFIYRYLNFQQLCSRYGYEKRDMVSIFPRSKNKKLDFSKNQDYDSAAKKFKANMEKLKGFISLDIIKLKLTLHSFRRGGIQHRQLNGESQESVMKQAGHASKGMNKLYNDNKHIRGKKIVESNDESKKEFEDNDDILPIMNDDNDDKNEDKDDKEDGDENEYEYEDEDDIHCVTCKKGDNEEEMLICECCERGYHYRCVGLKAIPEVEEWYCKDCHAEPKSEIVKGFETHVGRLIKYQTKPKGTWQHACVEFYNHNTKKHTLALGKFYNYEEAIGKIDRLIKVNNFDMKEEFQCKRLRFTDKDRWKEKKKEKKNRNRPEKRKQKDIEYEDNEYDSDHYETE